MLTAAGEEAGILLANAPNAPPNSYIWIQAFFDLATQTNHLRFLPRLSLLSVFPTSLWRHHPIEISELFASSLRTSTGRSNILSTVIFGGKRVYVDLSARSHLHFPTAFESLRPLRQPDVHTPLRFFPISLRKLNLPTNTSTRENSSYSRDQTHSRNCDSRFIDCAKIAVANGCYCLSGEGNLAGRKDFSGLRGLSG